MSSAKTRRGDDPTSWFTSPPFRRPQALAKAFRALWDVEILKPRLEILRQIVLPEAAEAADPDQAIILFVRLIEAGERPESMLELLDRYRERIPFLIRLLGDSSLLSEYLIGHTEALEKGFLAADLNNPRPIDMRRRDLAADIQGSEADAVAGILRCFKKRELFQIGAKDLLFIPPVEEITRELTELADVILDAALSAATATVSRRFGVPMASTGDGAARPAAFTVIGMGKLGGGELNFSSDIDLMFVYDLEGETTGRKAPNGASPVSNHAYFTKLSEELIWLVGGVTEEGYCFRVDLGLRPEGRSGALARSLYNYEIYYESWGVTWERQALIKCRPVAGDVALGRRFVEMVKPFVYRKYLDFASLTEIKQMKERIDREMDRRGETLRQVKLGRGGIREIEFIVQSLQLIHGGRIYTIRESQTLAAITRLEEKGLLREGEAQVLSEAYRFLRRVEHGVQIVQGSQTHLLPEDPEQLRALARRIGLPTADALVEIYQGHTRRVRRIFEDLFYQPEESPMKTRVPEETAMIMGREIDPEQVTRVFRRFGIRNTERAYRNLILLLEGKESRPLISPKGRSLLANLMPELLRQVQKSPDPDLAFDHLERFLAESGGRDLYLKTLGENPKVMELLVELFGTSVFLSNILIRNPGLFERLTRVGYLAMGKSAKDIQKELARTGVAKGSLVQRILDIRRYKKEEVFRIGLRDILELADLPEVTAELTALAEGTLSHILSLFMKGARGHPRIAIIGMGKLGGREMNYGSDLDILFVHDPSPGRSDGQTEDAHRTAEQVIEAVSGAGEEGILYKIDARLRPFGRTGVLTQTVAAYRTYFQEHAQTWERQALIKARPVAGDTAIGAAFMEEVVRFTYGYGLLKSEARAITDMRNRMASERETIQPGAFHLKLSAGGIVDVEFSVQALQLRHGHANADIRNPKTILALDALVRSGVLPRLDHDVLREGYLFMRRVENRLRIVHDVSDDVIVMEPLSLEALARRLGYGAGGGARLLSDLDDHRARIAEVARRIIREG